MVQLVSRIMKKLQNLMRLKAKESHIVSKIYWRHIYCPAALQLKLSDLKPVPNVYNGFQIKELPYNSPMFDEYLSFINVMYEEKIYKKEELIQLLSQHSWLKDVKTYILTNDSGHIVSTISTGIYKNNEEWGGIFKFATDKSMRKQGLGLYMLRYGYGILRDCGCSYGESIVSFRNSRIPSLMAHFKCGFKPQTNRKLVKLNMISKRGGLKHWFTRRWVLKYYYLFLEKHK